jgi:predicted Zn-dependent peptidase
LDPGLLIIQGQVAEGITLQDAEKALDEALDNFVRTGIQEEDLQRVKNQAEASLVFGEVEVLNRAMSLAMAANAGNVDFVNNEAEQIASVPLKDLQYWAEHLFVQGKKNTLLYRKQS